MIREVSLGQCKELNPENPFFFSAATPTDQQNGSSALDGHMPTTLTTLTHSGDPSGPKTTNRPPYPVLSGAGAGPKHDEWRDSRALSSSDFTFHIGSWGEGENVRPRGLFFFYFFAGWSVAHRKPIPKTETSTSPKNSQRGQSYTKMRWPKTVLSSNPKP